MKGRLPLTGKRTDIQLKHITHPLAKLKVAFGALPKDYGQLHSAVIIPKKKGGDEALTVRLFLHRLTLQCQHMHLESGRSVLDTLPNKEDGAYANC